MSGRHRRAGPPVDAADAAAGPPSAALPVADVPASGEYWPTQVLEPVPAMAGPASGPALAPAMAPAAGAHAAVATPLPTTSPAPVPLRPGLPEAPAPLISPPPAGAGSAAEAVAVLPAIAGAIPGRRAEREQRRRRAKRSRLVAIVALVVLALVVGGFILIKAMGGGNGGSGHAGPPARTQTTLLIRLVGQQNQTLAAALLGHTTTGQGTGFGALLPQNLEVAVPGSGTTTLANASVVAGQSGASNAVADALGVIVDGSWTLNSSGLATLVNSIGGIDVTVDTNVVAKSGGGTVVAIPAGPHHLNGQQAALYATYLGGGEPEQQRLARLSTVLQALFARLPSSPSTQKAILTQLGAGSVSSLSTARLASVLSGLRSDATGGRLAFNDVPMTSLDSATGASVLSVNSAALKPFVQTNFAGSLPSVPPGGPVRVLVQNAVGTPGLGATARNRLVAAGLTYVAGGNASQFGQAKSLILINNASAASMTQGQETARALRLPFSDIRINPSGQSVADVIVILGADYRP
jgi:hypothetical protein